MAEDITENLVTSVDCKQGAVRAVRFNADGNYCLTCGSNKTVKLWNPHRGSVLKTYIGHGYEVLDAQSSSDNSQICSGGMDKTVVVFDVSTGHAVRKYRGHAGTVNCVKFNEESTVVLSGSLDSTVQAWDCRSRKTTPIQVMDEAKDSVTSIQVSDHEILTGSADGRVRRYDLRNGKLFSDYIGTSVTSVTFTRDGQCTLASTLDNKLRLLDKDSGELLNEYEGHKNKEYKIDSCLNWKDTHIVSGSEDGFVYIWDLIDAKLLQKLDHSTTRAVHSLSFHPSEACLLTASADKLYVWKDRYAASLS
ncbi:WD repeat domain-containing protein 83-like [Haliotis rubra]|uniref:WD repeat domain-containing protein 83-like n=1 Tax=Haliotis rubra TaxID=36100 RepID=UPI001EE56969|nr:WD repeat domain-containing protein 83-like [Haliotis rubra]